MRRRTYLSLLVVDHDIMGLNISVHYTLAMAEIQRLQQLINIVADVVVLELGIQASEVGVVDIFEY
jgi:hypothetical protein